MTEWWFYSGVRTGEAFGLRWPNVDLRNARMLIAESVVLGEERDSTKTGVARSVILNSRALAAIQRQRAVSMAGMGHVWTHPFDNLGWTDERAYRRNYWEPTLKRLGIRYRRPYTMRHTFATMMLMAGRTPAWCAKQLGHSIEMFLGTYSKWIDGDQDARELAGLESWLGEGNKQGVV
jgi:integrase